MAMQCSAFLKCVVLVCSRERTSCIFATKFPLDWVLFALVLSDSFVPDLLPMFRLLIFVFSFSFLELAHFAFRLERPAGYKFGRGVNGDAPPFRFLVFSRTRRMLSPHGLNQNGQSVQGFTVKVVGVKGFR